MKRILCLFLLFGTQLPFLFGQEKVSFKDSLDHKFDVSDWVLTANGFIPIPVIITEPALGGIGGALFTIFVDVNTPYRDTINGELVTTRAKPNLYGVGGAYTANGTWAFAGVSIGTIKKYRLNYRLISAYADVNLEFFRELENGDEHSFEFNLHTFPVFGQLVKHFKGRSWYTGLNYLFLNTKIQQSNPEFHSAKEVNSNVSRLGVMLEYDTRDNVFTPDKGFRWNSVFGVADDALGSDYDYTSLNSAAFYYLPISKRIISGFRAEYQQMWGDPPFYLLPFINMRGIPVARYQGTITALAETEWRWDLTPRVSLVTFGGAGKAIPEESSFEESKWRYSGGAGTRYLIARKLKLRGGIDVARGPEQWAYYIVFGTTWTR